MISEDAFPVEPWQVRETHLNLDLLAQSESVFALSNGHIGLRGNLDEGEPHGLPGTYLNSFYEIRPLPYAEAGYGYPEAGQTVVNVTNGKIIRLLVDDEPFDVRYGELLDHERVLDLRAGTLTRRATGAPRPAQKSRSRRRGWCRWPSAVSRPSSTWSRRSTSSSGSSVQSELVSQRGAAGDLGRPAGVGHPGQPAGGRRPRSHRQDPAHFSCTGPGPAH